MNPTLPNIGRSWNPRGFKKGIDPWSEPHVG